MNMRGKWATAPPSLKLNVTSAQSVTSKNRAAFEIRLWQKQRPIVGNAYDVVHSS
jgi:hypothetical protein